MTEVIGFSGCSCSGKSTTLQRVKEMLEENGYSVYVVPEVARDILREKSVDTLYVRRPGMYYEFEKTILLRHLTEINKGLANKADVVLTDRTVFDVAAYCILYGENLTEDEAKELFDVIDVNVFVYEAIYIFEPIKNREEVYNDGVRSSEAPPYLFNRLLEALMEDAGYTWWRIIGYDTVENRAKRIANLIEKEVAISKEVEKDLSNLLKKF